LLSLKLGHNTCLVTSCKHKACNLQRHLLLDSKQTPIMVGLRSIISNLMMPLVAVLQVKE
jgi:hypothetical protein